MSIPRKIVVSERAALRAITDYLSLHKMLYIRINPVRPVGRQGAITFVPIGDQKGSPDLLVIGPRWILALEVKSSTGKQSATQKAWEVRCLGLGHRYLVVRDVAEVARALVTMPRGWE